MAWKISNCCWEAVRRVFDLMVLGGGPAGYLAAERAGHAGLSVCCFEMRELGGVCLNEGCIPSKSLLNSAKIYDHALGGEPFGVVTKDIVLDHAIVQKRRVQVIQALVTGVRAKMRASGVTIIREQAVIDGLIPGGIAVRAGGSLYEGKRLLIATGSSPAIPPIPGLAESLQKGFVLTNREVLELPEVPERLTVIGGGVIGLEMAAYYRTAGSRVSVIEMLDHIAGQTDRELSELLLAEYRAKGVDFYLGAKVTRIQEGSVLFERTETAASVEADRVLLSIGRRANVQGIGLESIGVQFTASGISTDAQCQTNVPNVYAAGDVNGRSMLAHTAYREAEVAVHTMLGKKDRMRYHAIPSVIYTSPEVAGVGHTEETAADAGIAFETRKLSTRYAGRFVAENEGDGLCKILVNAAHRNIIGVHIIGPYASEIIWGAAQLIETELRVQDARELVFPHPTLSEIIREVLFEFHE
ncbi:MAG: dihydrolipoyl dehydrogenase [Clostridia bacterium]|nr:dihydrolipoyl dehydrogenase [Clostridia bacterium]